jgi:polysaccharide biosynthesis transport protein
MNLSYYIGVFWRRKWVIIATTLVTVGVVIFGLSRVPSAYLATATLRISTVASGSSDYLQFDLLYSDRLMRTYAQVATSRPLMESLVEQFDLSPDRLPKIETAIIEGTELLQLSVSSENPVIARDAANFLAEALVAYTQPLAGSAEPLTDPAAPLSPIVERGRAVPSIIEPAEIPDEAVGLNARLFTIMGAIVGLMGGLGLALVIQNLDTRVYSLEEIEGIIGRPVLGEVPHIRWLRNKKRILLDIDRYAEAFRWLLANLSATGKEQSLKTMVITSAEPEEGKSTIVANLAVCSGQSDKRVIVVDADLRRPTLHTVFNVDNNAGLSGVLNEDIPLEDVLQPTTFPGVTVLTSGTLSANPSQVLHPERVAALIGRLADLCDLVLVDTPAALAVADAARLAPLTDGVLLVVRHARIQRKTLQDLHKQLDRVDARVIGVVVNQMKESTHYHGYYASANKNITRHVPEDTGAGEAPGAKWDPLGEETQPDLTPRSRSTRPANRRKKNASLS